MVSQKNQTMEWLFRGRNIHIIQLGPRHYGLFRQSRDVPTKTYTTLASAVKAGMRIAKAEDVRLFIEGVEREIEKQ